MNKFIIYIGVIIFLGGCNSNNNEIRYSGNKSILPDSIIDSIDCICDSILPTPNRITQLHFINFVENTKKNDSIFLYWTRDSLRLKVKGIHFSEFDTIPLKFSIFENVEVINYDCWQTGDSSLLIGLDIFPKLKQLIFNYSTVTIDTNQEWLNNIEFLTCRKSKIIGLNNLNQLPNLKYLYMHWSDFYESFFIANTSHCINSIYIKGCRQNFDLSTFDFSNKPCLTNAEFVDVYDKMKSLPKNIDKSNLSKLIIKHNHLTKEEDAILDSFNKVLR